MGYKCASQAYYILLSQQTAQKAKFMVSIPATNWKNKYIEKDIQISDTASNQLKILTLK